MTFELAPVEAPGPGSFGHGHAGHAARPRVLQCYLLSAKCYLRSSILSSFHRITQLPLSKYLLVLDAIARKRNDDR